MRVVGTSWVLLGSLFLAGCGSGDEGERGGRRGTQAAALDGVAVYLAGLHADVSFGDALGADLSSAAGGRRLQAAPPEPEPEPEPEAEPAPATEEVLRACAPSRGMGPVAGVCVTPVNLRGWAEAISLGGEREDATVSPDGTPEPSRCGPGRLLAINGFSDTSDGPQRGGGLFDLNHPVPVGGNTALGCDEYPSTRWTSASVHLTYLEAEWPLAGAYYRVRFVFEANPLDQEPVFNEPMCGLGASDLERLSYLPTHVQVQRGDVLVCVTASADEPCADDAYQWIDRETGELA
ncbi:MAG TPA: hypothetical protein VKZ49_04985, partial [Polyangiaceae bacterium]|nr:hypothetical protein [Polyangiaceae bacterium]